MFQETPNEDDSAHGDNQRYRSVTAVNLDGKSRMQLFRSSGPFALITVGEKGPRPLLNDAKDFTSRKAKPHTRSTDQHQDFEQAQASYIEYQTLQQKLPLPSGLEFPHDHQRILLSLRRYIEQHADGQVELKEAYEKDANWLNRCRLTWYDQSSSSVEAEAIAPSKREARQAAAVRLLSKLYLAGAIDCARREAAALFRKEGDAKVAVYNYAARLGCFPQIQTKQASHGSVKGYTCTVKLPTWSIEASAFALTRENAEVFACAKVRRMSRRVHVGLDNRHANSSSCIFRGLRASVARKFMGYYKSTAPYFQFTIISKQHTANEWLGAAHASDQCIQEDILAATEQETLDLAFLVIAVHVLQRQPQAWEEFRKSVTTTSDKETLAARKILIKIDERQKYELQTALLRARHQGLQDLSSKLLPDRRASPGLLPQYTNIDGRGKDVSHSQEFFKNAAFMASSARAEPFAKLRNGLAARRSAPLLVQTVRQNDVCVVCGPPWSGKTTQIPQILFEEHIHGRRGGSFKLLCVLKAPKAVWKIAYHVARQRQEPFGYSIGNVTKSFDNSPTSASGSIVYCDIGYLTARLVQHGSNILDGLTHLMLDDADFGVDGVEMLMTLVRKALDARKQTKQTLPKIILTHSSSPSHGNFLASYFADINLRSSTLELHGPTKTPAPRYYLEHICNTLIALYRREQLSLVQHDRRYLELERDFAMGKRPVIVTDGEWANVGAKTTGTRLSKNLREFPEEEPYKIDESKVPLRLAAAVIGHLARTTDSGTILVFLPGKLHIDRLRDILMTKAPMGVRFNNASTFSIVTLNSSTASQFEPATFPSPEDSGRREIVLATELAEDAGPIPDLRFVLDLGKSSVGGKSDSGAPITSWATKSNIRKRQQRANLVQSGLYLALFTKYRERSMSEGPRSSIQQGLQKATLSIVASPYQTGAQTFFKAIPKPPADSVVQQTIEDLETMNALTKKEELTSLGRLSLALDIHPQGAKAIVHGLLFGCLEPMLLDAAARTIRWPFVSSSRDAAKEWHIFAGGIPSDQVAIYNAFKEVAKLPASKENQASKELIPSINLHRFYSLQKVVKTIAAALRNTSMLNSRREHGGPNELDALNLHSEEARLVEALLLSAWPHNIAVRVSPNRYCNARGQDCIVSSESIVHTYDQKVASTGLVFFSKMSRTSDGSTNILHRVSQLQPMAVLLFGGTDLEMVDAQELKIDGWLRFRFSKPDPDVIKLIVEFRKGLQRLSKDFINNLASDDPSPVIQQIRHVYMRALFKALSWNINDVEAIST